MNIWIANTDYYRLFRNSSNIIASIFFIKILFNGRYTDVWYDIEVEQSNSAVQFMKKFNSKTLEI